MHELVLVNHSESSFSVDQAKKKMLYESGEGARLQTENRELEFRLAQLRETHKLDQQTGSIEHLLNHCGALSPQS